MTKNGAKFSQKKVKTLKSIENTNFKMGSSPSAPARTKNLEIADFFSIFKVFSFF